METLQELVDRLGIRPAPVERKQGRATNPHTKTSWVIVYDDGEYVTIETPCTEEELGSFKKQYEVR